MKHTPIPWHVAKSSGPDYAKQFSIYAEGCRNDLALTAWQSSETNEANAKHIVHCVNVHDELVAVLEAIISADDDGSGDGEFALPLDLERRVKAALAKAKGATE